MTNSTGEGKFKINDAKLYVLYVILPTQDNAKLFQQLKPGCKRAISFNQYQSEPKTYVQNRYLNLLINSSFQGVNILFVLSFKKEDDRKSHSTCYLPRVETKECNVMINGKNIFDQPTNSNLKIFENITKIATGQVDGCTTSCLLDYSYFKNYY